MNAAGRLGLYAAGVAVAFVGAFAVSAAVIPESLAAGWSGEEEMSDHSSMEEEMTMTTDSSPTMTGLSLSAAGYALSPVTAPGSTGEQGELGFQILTPAGPLTDFATQHGKDLHLIVVRSDGDAFRHVHPNFDERTATWSLPWEWEKAGTYRVYADFTPGGGAAEGVTLTRTVEVAGEYQPVTARVSRAAQVDGYTVTIEGDLIAGSMSDLTVTVERGGEPVTELEPYLGAFGHLVALREGDLGYLHVHADGGEPSPGSTAGPQISFMAHATTPGRYLLYLDFQVDGQVRTAPFVLDTAAAAAQGASAGDHEGPHGH